MENLFDKLKKIFYLKRSEIKTNYNRVLPLNEMFTDRWEKAKFLGFGEGSSVYDSAIILGDVKVGKNTWIGANTVLDGSGGLEIGDNCSISIGVQIYSHDSVAWATSGGKEPYIYQKTIIEDNCYIGPNTIIAKGVKIGKKSIVGANSFVNKSIPEGSKYAGSPAKKI